MEATELLATDRCDKCGARAMVRVILPSGSDLLFCSHDFTANATALTEQAASITRNKEAVHA